MSEFNYPSTEGQGYEPVEIPREPYQGQIHGVDRVLFREAPEVIKNHIKTALSLGRLHSSLDHYAKVVDANPESFAPHVHEGLKTLFSEGLQAEGREAQAAWFEKFQTYLKSLRMAKG